MPADEEEIDPEAGITLDLAEDPLGKAAHESLRMLHSGDADNGAPPIEDEFADRSESDDHVTPTVSTGPRLSDALDINAVMLATSLAPDGYLGL